MPLSRPSSLPCPPTLGPRINPCSSLPSRFFPFSTASSPSLHPFARFYVLLRPFTSFLHAFSSLFSHGRPTRSIATVGALKLYAEPVPPSSPPPSKIENRKSKILPLLLIFSLLPAPLAPAATPNFARPNAITGKEINEAQQNAVDRGLTFLASKQRNDGSYLGYGNQGHAGITALAGLAFMSSGSLPGRGKYGEQVDKCLRFVLASSQESGLVCSDNTHGPMYGHGFATVFLGEIYGMTHGEEAKEKLQKAVRLLERTQNPEGGWRYQPVPFDADISVTIACVMGLRAARDAGIKVDKGVIENAVKYVRRCQNPDGGFSYMAGQGADSGFARSAAGVASLYYAGVFEGDDLKRGLNYLKQYDPRTGVGDGDGYFFYGHYYACQAMFLAGGEYWDKYYPAIRDVLIRRQQITGGWTGEAGVDYATSMALIILQMPNRYLPVFHGKGPGS